MEGAGKKNLVFFKLIYIFITFLQNFSPFKAILVENFFCKKCIKNRKKNRKNRTGRGEKNVGG